MTAISLTVIATKVLLITNINLQALVYEITGVIIGCGERCMIHFSTM